MKKCEIKNVTEFAKDLLGKKNNCVTVQRAVRFINSQPDDADIWSYDTCDWDFCRRACRNPMYDWECIGSFGPTKRSVGHGKFVFIMADKPEVSE